MTSFADPAEEDPFPFESLRDRPGATITWANVPRSTVDGGLSYRVWYEATDTIRFEGLVEEHARRSSSRMSFSGLSGLSGPVGVFESAHDIGSSHFAGSTNPSLRWCDSTGGRPGARALVPLEAETLPRLGAGFPADGMGFADVSAGEPDSLPIDDLVGGVAGYLGYEGVEGDSSRGSHGKSPERVRSVRHRERNSILASRAQSYEPSNPIAQKRFFATQRRRSGLSRHRDVGSPSGDHRSRSKF